MELSEYALIVSTGRIIIINNPNNINFPLKTQKLILGHIIRLQWFKIQIFSFILFLTSKFDTYEMRVLNWYIIIHCKKIII